MQDLFKNTAYIILELFIKYPSKNFSIREIARELKINHSTVIRYIKKLSDLELIIKKNDYVYPTYHSNYENENLKNYKKSYILFEIKNSGIIEYIYQKTFSSSIIMFGSSSKGTFNENSDIDIFVESKKTEFEFEKFEKKLNRKINILFEDKIGNLSKELKNNILNGTILRGFIRL